MAKKEQVNWSSFTKAELIKTVKGLHAKQTKLLNQIAKLESAYQQLADNFKSAATSVGNVSGQLIDQSGEQSPQPDASTDKLLGFHRRKRAEMLETSAPLPWETSLPNPYDTENGK